MTVNAGVSHHNLGDGAVKSEKAQHAEPAESSVLARLNARLSRLLKRPSLPLLTIAIGVGLTAPSLFIGFHLDDWIGRFIFSDLPGAARLYRIYSGGYGAANGNHADAIWMINEGFAPWWMDTEVLLSFYRPISLATHLLDAALWPNSAIMWHAHSLLWLGILIWCAIRAYRSVQGPVVGGLAALLFAVDQAHAMPVSFITNRYILIATAMCLLALQAHHEGCLGARRARWLAPFWYALSLFAGESSAAVVGYFFSYALFVDGRALKTRVLSLVPYLSVSVVWRAAYNAMGHGARGSALYIDPVHEPARFAVALVERGPALLVGQWFLPPAETFTLTDASTASWLIIYAWAFTVVFAIAVWPLLRRDKLARFWAAGMVISLVPMCSGEPHNRMLFVASIGAAGLLAQWWHAYAPSLAGAKNTLGAFSRGVGIMGIAGHLVLSALIVPFNSCGLMLFGAHERAFNDVGAEAVGKDAVFVTSPDYFAVRLVRMGKAVEHVPSPRRWHPLAFGPEQVSVTRAGDKALILDYANGAMREATYTKQSLDLYRSADKPLHQGDRIALDGLTIEVLEVTPDGRPLQVRFDFEASLDAERYRFYYWTDNHFRPLELPAVGETQVLPRAELYPELPS